MPFLARVITLIESEERTDIPEALWQRLNIFTLTLPPLRERKEDILPLFRLFLLQENIQRFRGGSELQELLEFYSWPGNLVALSAVSKRYAQYLSRAVRSNAGTRRLMLQQAIGEEELLRDLCYKYPALNHIEDNPHNYTRFLIMSDPRKADFLRALNEADKSSIVFSLPHEEGSLSQVLSILSFYKINLTKIQSLPIIGREWEYLFYVDVTYDDLTRYRQSIDAITPLTRDLIILGEYKAA